MEETENLGFARLDHDRARRKGAVETIFCQGKTADQVAAIFERFAAHDGCALGTRATEEQYRAVRERVPAACYNPLGRVIYRGSALPNTNIPGLIGGYAGERVLRAPADGIFCQKLEIGAVVRAGDVAGEVAGQPMRCTIDGVLRGILADGTPVFRGMKAGDVDPRCKPEYCTTASDKALAVGGGVLEAVLHLHHQHPKTGK